MRLISLLGLAYLTSSTIAAPVNTAQQDTAVIDRSLRNISNALKGLANIVQQFDQTSRRGGYTDKQQQLEIERRGADVANALRDSANQIRRIQILSTLEAASTVGPIEELGGTTQRTVDVWISAKPSIVRSGGRQTVLSILAAQELANDEFVDAISGRMPAMSITAARYYGQKSKGQIDSVIAAYNRP